MNDNEISRCLNDPDYLVKKYYRNKKYCMAYNNLDCSGDICNAHIISKRYLVNLAQNSHVYMPKASFHHKNNLYEFELEGIIKATCVTSFCKTHDNSLFQSFEKEIFSGEYTQIYDLTFRAICREYFQKKCLLDFYNQIKDNKFHKLDQTGYARSDDFKRKQSNLVRELRDHKFIYKQLKKYNFCGLNYLIIKTSKMLPLATSGIFFPRTDSEGNIIQHEKHKQHGFVYNIIPRCNDSYIIISTVPSLHNNIHRIFLQHLKDMSMEYLINYFMTYSFSNNDNIVIDPKWYENLSQKFKHCLDMLLNYQVGNYGEINELYRLSDFYKEFEIPDITVNLVI